MTTPTYPDAQFCAKPRNRFCANLESGVDYFLPLRPGPTPKSLQVLLKKTQESLRASSKEFTRTTTTSKIMVLPLSVPLFYSQDGRVRDTR